MQNQYDNPIKDQDGAVIWKPGQQHCQFCGCTYHAKRYTSAFCTVNCRVNAARFRKAGKPYPQNKLTYRKGSSLNTKIELELGGLH